MEEQIKKLLQAYVVVFSDGLEPNVSSAVYSYLRKQGHKTVYFNCWG
jgi:hypothetical protein